MQRSTQFARGFVFLFLTPLLLDAQDITVPSPDDLRAVGMASLPESTRGVVRDIVGLSDGSLDPGPCLEGGGDGFMPLQSDEVEALALGAAAAIDDPVIRCSISETRATSPEPR